MDIITKLPAHVEQRCNLHGVPEDCFVHDGVLYLTLDQVVRSTNTSHESLKSFLDDYWIGEMAFVIFEDLAEKTTPCLTPKAVEHYKESVASLNDQIH